jgi:hypothetical protein
MNPAAERMEDGNDDDILDTVARHINVLLGVQAESGCSSVDYL